MSLGAEAKEVLVHHASRGKVIFSTVRSSFEVSIPGKNCQPTARDRKDQKTKRSLQKFNLGRKRTPDEEILLPCVLPKREYTRPTAPTLKTRIKTTRPNCLQPQDLLTSLKRGHGRKPHPAADPHRKQRKRDLLRAIHVREAKKDRRRSAWRTTKKQRERLVRERPSSKLPAHGDRKINGSDSSHVT